jgi:hypothetical protein
MRAASARIYSRCNGVPVTMSERLPIGMEFVECTVILRVYHDPLTTRAAEIRHAAEAELEEWLLAGIIKHRSRHQPAKFQITDVAIK